MEMLTILISATSALLLTELDLAWKANSYRRLTSLRQV
jgi:hypothetical protein